MCDSQAEQAMLRQAMKDYAVRNQFKHYLDIIELPAYARRAKIQIIPSEPWDYLLDLIDYTIETYNV